MKKYLEDLKGLYIAHRGLYNNEKGIPENSMKAFNEALKRNIIIELDVHLLKDGKMVIIHDDNLKRMKGYDKDLKDCTYEEVSKLRLLDTDEKVPLLEDVLELVDGKVMLDIELKYDVEVGKLETELCKYLDKYEGKFIVKSFRTNTVKWIKENRPEYIVGQLATYKNEEIRNKELCLKGNICEADPDFIAYDLRTLPNNEVAECREKGIPVLIWTVKTKEDLEKAKLYGDTFISEHEILLDL